MKFFSSVFFGNTVDEITYTISGLITSIDKKVSYNGIRPILTSQFKLDSSLTFGLNVKFPTRVNTTKIQFVTVLNDSGTSSLEIDERSDTDDFCLPLNVGLGVNKSFKSKLNMTFDCVINLGELSQIDIESKFRWHLVCSKKNGIV